MDRHITENGWTASQIRRSHWLKMTKNFFSRSESLYIKRNDSRESVGLSVCLSVRTPFRAVGTMLSRAPKFLLPALESAHPLTVCFPAKRPLSLFFSLLSLYGKQLQDACFSLFSPTILIPVTFSPPAFSFRRESVSEPVNMRGHCIVYFFGEASLHSYTTSFNSSFMFITYTRVAIDVLAQFPVCLSFGMMIVNKAVEGSKFSWTGRASQTPKHYF